MKLRKIVTFALLTSSMVAFSTNVEITPGQLSELMKDKLNETTLTVSGSMDARDFKFISESLPELTTVDLTNVTITAYSSNEACLGNAFSYKADELPLLSFFDKKITSVALPKNLKSVGEGAFSGCRELASVTLPASLESIGEYAFYDCDKLADVELPANLKIVGSYAFGSCDALKSVKVNASDAFEVAPYMFNNCKALTTVTLPSTTKVIGEGAFKGCNAMNAFSFPLNLTTIGNDAFKGVQLAEVNISKCEQLNTIGDWAFADNSSLAKLSLPKGLSSIGAGAFFMATELVNLPMPEVADSISDFFAYGAAKVNGNLVMPAQLTKIGKYAFAEWTSILSYEMPETLAHIDDNAFRNNSGLKEITIHTTDVPTLGETVFEGIDQPNTLLKVEENMVQPFKTAEQWKEFKIETSSSTELTDAGIGLKAYFNDKILVVEASEVIDEALLYDISGATLSRKQTDSNVITFDTSDFFNPMYIVSGKLASGKIFSIKLIRQ